MSALRPTPLLEFYRALHARGQSTDTIAATLGVSGGAVRRVIGGLRRRGRLWDRVAALLTTKEILLLCHVEQCSAWNARPARRHRPTWSEEKARELQPA